MDPEHEAEAEYHKQLTLLCCNRAQESVSFIEFVVERIIHVLQGSKIPIHKFIEVVKTKSPSSECVDVDTRLLANGNLIAFTMAGQKDVKMPFHLAVARLFRFGPTLNVKEAEERGTFISGCKGFCKGIKNDPLVCANPYHIIYSSAGCDDDESKKKIKSAEPQPGFSGGSSSQSSVVQTAPPLIIQNSASGSSAFVGEPAVPEVETVEVDFYDPSSFLAYAPVEVEGTLEELEKDLNPEF